MEYPQTNSSWQKRDAIRRQYMAYSKLTREKSNFYKDSDYGGNAYSVNTIEMKIFTHRRQMGIGKFFPRAKTFDHMPYDDHRAYEGVIGIYDYCENSPYDIYKGYHGSHDYKMMLLMCLNCKISMILIELFYGEIFIAAFNASSSNVACLLWLFKGLDPRTNPFK
ncbi:hypothetical protein M9H77_35991 [Catharanthus roseus]|uniref:Uncharacterized protein n=1 Tax=Catharanthus roseus TaxID=4058 RepID=A0ACB9ZQJ0_CATRO|nr:hypothetical protein M9H77_35991 [Catharanthus roseus]